MRHPLALLLAASLAARCPTTRPDGDPNRGAGAEPAAELPARPGAVPIVLIGACLVIQLIANSGLSPSPDPPG